MNANMEEFSTSDKVDILLYALDAQMKSLQQSEDREQQFFQWSTNLLLAAFGALIALSGGTRTLSFPILVKLLATILIVVPASLSIVWIFRRSKRSVNMAEAIERIQKLLHLYEEGYYGPHAPYPSAWEGSLVKGRLQRKTPLYYAAVIVLMAVCVVVAIWLIL
jgi:hypothetical protein